MGLLQVVFMMRLRLSTLSHGLDEPPEAGANIVLSEEGEARFAFGHGKQISARPALKTEVPLIGMEFKGRQRGGLSCSFMPDY